MLKLLPKEAVGCVWRIALCALTWPVCVYVCAYLWVCPWCRLCENAVSSGLEKAVCFLDRAGIIPVPVKKWEIWRWFPQSSHRYMAIFAFGFIFDFTIMCFYCIIDLITSKVCSVWLNLHSAEWFFLIICLISHWLVMKFDFQIHAWIH